MVSCHYFMTKHIMMRCNLIIIFLASIPVLNVYSFALNPLKTLKCTNNISRIWSFDALKFNDVIHLDESVTKESYRQERVSDRRTMIKILSITIATIHPIPCSTIASASTTTLATSTAGLPKTLGEEYRQGTAALADPGSTAPVPREAYVKLPSGVSYADLRVGKGMDTAQRGSRVNLQWVLRKSNGYFVDSSEKNDSVPFIFVIGDGTAIQGLDEAVQGMNVGGVRRILIPPALAYVEGLEDGKPGPLPNGFGPRQQMRRVQGVRKDVPGEYIYLEVQLTRLR